MKKVFNEDIVAILKNGPSLLFSKVGHFFDDRQRIILAKLKNLLRKLNNILIKIWLDKRLLIPIIIFQPGKVGSISVQKSLIMTFERLDLRTPVYHAHQLNRIEKVEEFIKNARKEPSRSLRKLAESKTLRQEIDGDPSKKWNIISLVRDPVALRVSAMFQVLDEYFPDWADLTEENKLSIQDLQHLLMSKQEFNPKHLAAWFDNQMKSLFGLDVFSMPFNIKQGFTIYRLPDERFSIMIIRLEDLDRVAPEAFRQFIGVKKFEVIKKNVGEEKPYRELYKKFKSFPLPTDYLDAAYNTRYARHFYTPEEIEIFRKRWLDTATPSIA